MTATDMPSDMPSDAPPDAPSDARALVPPATRAGARASLAERALRAYVSRADGELHVVLPDRTVLSTPRAREPSPVMWIDDAAFFDRVVTDGKIGFGESYMAGEWRADDLVGVLEVWARNIERVPVSVWRLARLLDGGQPDHHRNTVQGSSRNISHHYDLSNDLFATFLDTTMTYSAAVFEPGDSLADAQRRKYDLLCSGLGLRSGHHILEIGTGWGGFAVHAAERYGVDVTTVTISEEQHALARRRVAEAGLDDRVEVLLRDYRDVEGRYDHIVSIEMFEAVGEEYWPTFFRRLGRLVRPGGRIALQTITMPHDRWQAARGGYGWINKYIFPGGEIPSLRALRGPVRDAGLRPVAMREVGPDYATTLRHWRERFLADEDRVRHLGFDTTFVRLWEFYLAYCEAGFRTGALGNAQLLLEPERSTA